jgi:hypothetical protein
MMTKSILAYFHNIAFTHPPVTRSKELPLHTAFRILASLPLKPHYSTSRFVPKANRPTSTFAIHVKIPRTHASQSISRIAHSNAEKGI